MQTVSSMIINAVVPSSDPATACLEVERTSMWSAVSIGSRNRRASRP